MISYKRLQICLNVSLVYIYKLTGKSKLFLSRLNLVIQASWINSQDNIVKKIALLCHTRGWVSSTHHRKNDVCVCALLTLAYRSQCSVLIVRFSAGQIAFLCLDLCQAAWHICFLKNTLNQTETKTNQCMRQRNESMDCRRTAPKVWPLVKMLRFWIFYFNKNKNIIKY